MYPLRGRQFAPSFFSSLLSGLTLFALAFAPRPAAAVDWVDAGGDPAHRRATDERAGAVFDDGAWRASAPAGTYATSSPAVADGVAVVGAHDGTLRAFDAITGRLLWRYRAADGVATSPAVDRETVYFSSLDGRLHALRVTDGAALWERPLGEIALGSPTVVAGSVLVTGGFPARTLARLDGRTGELLWQTPPVLAQFSNSQPVVAGDVVVLGAMEGSYHAFDLATGAPRWTYQADGIVNLSAPAVIGGRVFFQTGDTSRKVHGVAADTGLALPGFPVELPAPPAEQPAPVVTRQAVSSMAAAGELLVFTTRFDESLDANGDRLVDAYRLREYVTALDARDGHLVWQAANGRLLLDDTNQIPKGWLAPTPAMFHALDGSTLIAAASSLSPSVRTLDAASGAERWRAPVAAPALASPVVANGRLFVATRGGALDAFLSSGNHPPPTPGERADLRAIDAAAPVLRWAPAFDPDGDTVSYVVRVQGSDVATAPLETSLRLPLRLPAKGTLSFQVRSRDSRGALSAWSPAKVVEVLATPDFDVNGSAARDLAAALAAARPGDVVGIGAGVLRLERPLSVPAGVALRGAGAGATVVDGSGLPTAISLEGGGAERPTELAHLTVTGAARGVVAASGEARVHHVVVHGCSEVGIEIITGASARLVNVTLARNGQAVRAAGSVTVTNGIVVSNRVGLAVERAGLLTSRYTDVAGNQTDLLGVAPGASDLTTPVTFAAEERGDFRLMAAQGTTDRGDPQDDASQEPAPNGGRVNLGAFGGTADAELSPPASTGVGADPSAVPGTPEVDPSSPAAGGCSIAAGAHGRERAPASLAGLIVASLALALARARRRR